MNALQIAVIGLYDGALTIGSNARDLRLANAAGKLGSGARIDFADDSITRVARSVSDFTTMLEELTAHNQDELGDAHRGFKAIKTMTDRQFQGELHALRGSADKANTVLNSDALEAVGHIEQSAARLAESIREAGTQVRV